MEEPKVPIEELKAAYPNRPLFSVELADTLYVFKNLTRQEYLEIEGWARANPEMPVSEFDDRVVDEALVWPDRGPLIRSMEAAGIVPTLSQLITEKSLMDANSTELNSLRITTLVPVDEEEALDEKVVEEIVKKAKQPLRLIRLYGKHFIIRPVVRIEFSNIRRRAEKELGLDVDTETVKLCTVYPSNINWDELPAGIPAILSQQVLNLSGFVEVPKVDIL